MARAATMTVRTLDGSKPPREPKIKRVTPPDHRSAHAADLDEDRREMAALRGVESISEKRATEDAIAAIDVDTLGSASAGVAAFEGRREATLGDNLHRAAGSVTDDVEPGVVEVPLSRLAIHPDNVRRTGRKAKVDDLVASIRARGLLQNLLVVADPAKPGHWLVKAGGRRLRALQALAKEGALAADVEVSVRILGDGEHAAEASLAENLHRVALNVADEIAAFKAFVDGGEDVAAIALRFGVDERHVAGRLRLAGLHDKVMNALRDGTISLDSAKAYASVDAPERQAEVFKDQWQRNIPDAIRRAMRAKLAKASDGLAIVVGRDGYLAAGGRIEADLFTDAADEVWIDAEILLRLGREALHAGAVELQRKFGFGKMVLAERPRGAPAAADIEGLTPYGERQDWTMLPEGARSQLLVSAYIANDGRVALYDRAWVIKGDMIVAPAEARLPEPPDDDARDFPRGGDSDGLDDGEGRDGEVTAGDLAGATKPAIEPAKTPDSVRDMLAMRRRDVLRLHLGGAFDTARDVAAFLLADRVAGPKVYGAHPHASAIENHDRAEPIANAAWDDELAGHLADQRAALADDWTGVADPAARWLAFRSLPTADKAAWLAWATAASLRAWENNYSRKGAALHDAIGVSIKAKPHVYWRPTAANYFGRVRRAGCLAFLAEIGVPSPAAKDAPWAKLKAGPLADLCEAIATGDAKELGFGETKTRAIGRAGEAWVPTDMRFGGAA